MSNNLIFTEERYQPYFEFWKQFLEDFEDGFSFKQTNFKASSTSKKECLSFELEEANAKAIRQMVGTNEIGVLVILSAATAILLEKYTSNNNVLINSPLLKQFVKGTIYTERVPLPIKLNTEISFKELIKDQQQLLKRVCRYQNFPTRLLERFAKDGEVFRTPVSIVYDPVHISADQTHPLNIQYRWDEEKLLVDLCYDKALYKESTLQYLGSHINKILSAVNSTKSIRDIAIISDDEKEEFDQFNSRTFDLPFETVPQAFEANANQYPRNNALFYDKRHYTYQELHQETNKLAAGLRKRFEIKPDDIVGIIVENPEHMIMAILGVLKSGAAYLPIDPNYPEERKTFMLDDAQVKFVITETDIMFSLDYYSGPLFAIDIEMSEMEEVNKLPCINQPDDLAYVIYTSGSTGQPKGVMVQHRSAVNMALAQINEFGITQSDKTLQFASFSFDASVSEIFTSFFSGAELVLMDKGVINNTAAFVKYARATSSSIVTLPPAYLVTLPIDQLSFLRVIITAGEAARVKDALEASQSVEYYNAYGPTECTVCVSIQKVDAQQTYEDNIPIGKPISNVQAYIVNESDQLVPKGIVGELYVGGAGVAKGYIHQPELTSERFIEKPFSKGQTVYKTGDLARWREDGTLEYLGRNDQQVKVKGYRIEIGEIESRLSRHQSIVDAIVISHTNLVGELELIAYYTASGAEDIKGLRDYMKASLPEYMIPSHFVKLSTIPLTNNGKVNRELLPIPKERQSDIAYKAPSNEVENVLTKIWQQVLGFDQVGIKDNFFSLGGDSIKAIQIASRASAEKLNVEVNDVLMYPTIEQLSEHVSELHRTSDQSVVIGEVPLTPIQYEFFEFTKVDHNHYNQAVMLHCKNRLDKVLVEVIFNKIQEHHDALRMKFVLEQGQTRQFNNGLDHSFVLREFDLIDQENPIEQLEAKANELHTKIDLENGPLMQLGLFHLKDADRLLIIIHHLVIDGISWRMIFEDIQSLYILYKQGEELTLPLKTDAYKLWGEKLQEYAASNELLEELNYWENVKSKGSDLITTDFDSGQNKIKDAETLSVKLTEGETDQLLTQVNTAYSTDVNDVLLASLALGFKNKLNINKLGVALEGHGRETIGDDINISRTVGWFTSSYPVMIEYPESSDLSLLIKGTKENLRQVPNKGVGYGILKNLSPKDLIKGRDFEMSPLVSFNYLGQFDADLENRFFEIADEAPGTGQSPDRPREFLIDVSCIIIQKRLHLSMDYSKNQFKKESVGELLEKFKGAIQEVIKHCIEKEETELTPSDLTHDKLSITDLENISSMFE